jgi:hypothetical protein
MDLGGGRTATAVTVTDTGQLPCAMDELGLPHHPAVVVVGGAGGLDGDDISRLRILFTSAIVPVMREHGAAGVDGGTDSGVMRLLGQARSAAGAGFPLLGVVAEGTVQMPGEAPVGETAPLEPNHSHFLLVPGNEWGAESPWIAETATVLAGARASITILINGGQIAFDDVQRSLDAGRRVIVAAGSGRTADTIAAAIDGTGSDQRAAAMAATGLISAVPCADPAAMAAAVGAALRGGER